MAFKYTRNSTGNQGTFFQDDEVCKHGDFIKSPPPQLFTTQSSWKKRCFTLCKSSERCYTLKYLKGQQIKGFIAIDQISNIEIGISNYEKMTAVRKMFKCHPEEVLSINTESREYYLIGKDREQVEDWFTSLSSVRMKVKEDGRFAQNQNPEAQRSKGRSLSSPPAFDDTVMSTYEEIPSDCGEVEDLADDKKRPHSDPGSRGLPEQQPRHSSPTRLLPSLNNNSEKTSINQLLLDSDENTRAEEEDYYASPSSILAQLESELSKSDPPVQSHNPMENEDHLCRKLYVSMKPLLPEEKLQPTCRSDEFLTLPRSQENSIDLRNCEADGNQQQLTQSSTNKQLTQERKPNVSSLSVVQLSIIINNVTDDSQLQEVDICIPHADVTSNLTLIEAAGQICVSHWKGPYRLGCIFHHGDHIVAVNDLRTQSIDEVSLFVSRSRRKEVKLTVRRIPDSDIFHIKGCSCS
ncbi:pleckstrin homology domain-containing family S member 1 isoform X1 [Gopherus flavomarginatus]|uniref:pleckstrin homology domain-containing family S member 1 isoform X1 n=1 Tax=Gopherus flavomarginatus TaxID=286002 RepID=UPI0021CBD5E8|nr:pleckstrin homology domain-containing family S member 1 isoform X1 [Gopherus flavomarginatus]XP_050814982.1 pleckstrin homology domain-containing family S member 1 isoform X1 [Gopherus flavomarginatus]